MWPDDLPADCPPAEAEEVERVVYRFVKAEPLTVDDFARPIDKPRKTPPAADEMCEMCALSVFADTADLPVARQFIPGFKKKRVAEGTVTADDGVMQCTPTTVAGSPMMSSHHDWWVPEGVDPLPKFTVVNL